MSDAPAPVQFEIPAQHDIVLLGNTPKQLMGKWDPGIKPDIVVCDSLHISRSRVMMAVKFWEQLGYEFGEIRFNDKSRSCTESPMYFEIVIGLPSAGYDWSYLAVTRVYKHAHTKEILWATVQIQQTQVTKQRVLEHEIGHALCLAERRL